MVTSANIGLDLPARGSNVGVWDTPVNGDFSILDQAFGSVTTIALTSAAVTLATSQAQNAVLRFTGLLTANVAVTLPAIYKFWTVDNQVTNSPSSFCVTLVSTSGTSIIGLPPGNQDVYYDGTSVKYKNLGKLGEYWDYAASTVPSWVTASTIPPYLNCNGTTFSSATYPTLANLLGTVTLPDSRGRYRAALNQTTSRLTSTYGVDGDTAYSGGGAQTVTIGSSNLPNSIPYKDPGHSHTPGATLAAYAGASIQTQGGFQNTVSPTTISSAVTGITINPSTAAAGTDYALTKVPPTYIGGITMIKAIP